MKKANRMKIMNWILIFLCVAFLVFTAVYSVRQETTERNYREIGEDEDLVIASLNVGKADCSILAYQGSFGLIDTGTKDAYELIDKVLSLNHQQTVDYLIITHYDKDHVGSAVKLLQNYNVKKISSGRNRGKQKRGLCFGRGTDYCERYDHTDHPAEGSGSTSGRSG